MTFLARALNAKAEPTAAFDDVDPEAFYAAAVAWAVENGVTEGTGEGTFSPGRRLHPRTDRDVPLAGV